MLERLIARIIIGFIRLRTGAQACWRHCTLNAAQRIHFANHASHGDCVLLPFKRGLFHLATQYPRAERAPLWMKNLGRMMPKSEWIPVPLPCTITFGPPHAPRPARPRLSTGRRGAGYRHARPR